jgi:hypothetical protein
VISLDAIDHFFAHATRARHQTYLLADVIGSVVMVSLLVAGVRDSLVILAGGATIAVVMACRILTYRPPGGSQ